MTTQIWPWGNFPRHEMMCRCGCGRADMDPQFMNALQTLRNSFGKKMVVTSAFRCPEHNAAEAKTGTNGPHTTGRAVDISVQGADALRLIALALPLGFTGIGVKQHGSGRYLHLDNLPNGPSQPRPWIWSY